MQKSLLFIFLILGSLSQSFAQGGKIVYNRKYNWINIATKLPYLSQEEKDRIKTYWGKEDEDNKGTNFLLTYNDSGSVYKEMEKVENLGYDWSDEEDIFIRDFDQKTTKDIRILLGKKYVIEDDIPRYKWKILNELKDIGGYVCMKAELKDTINDVVIQAWFTDKLPGSLGPEGFGGLPGTILALDFNDDDVNIIGTKIEVIEDAKVELPFPKKIKGKPLKYAEYYAKKKKHILLSIEGKRNPYWEMRY